MAAAILAPSSFSNGYKPLQTFPCRPFCQGFAIAAVQKRHDHPEGGCSEDGNKNSHPARPRKRCPLGRPPSVVCWMLAGWMLAGLWTATKAARLSRSGPGRKPDRQSAEEQTCNQQSCQVGVKSISPGADKEGGLASRSRRRPTTPLPAPARARRRQILAACVLFLGGGPFASGALAAADQSASDLRLQHVESALETSRGHAERLRRRGNLLAAETERVRRAAKAAAAAIQEREKIIAELTEQLDSLRQKEHDLTDELAGERTQIAELLMALQRLARLPPAAILFTPLAPADAIRGGIVLTAAAREIERRSRRLQRQLDVLLMARADIADRRSRLAASVAKLHEERSRLKELLAEKAARQRTVGAETREAIRRARRLARQAKDLKDLVAGLSKPPRRPVVPSPPAPPVPPSPQVAAVPPVARSRTPHRYPVVGRLVRQFGAMDASGTRAKGIRLATRPAAQVVAPGDGRVAFAGPFRGYGLLLIIEHQQSYHSLLAGLARIDIDIGQRVVAGEPIGVMGRPRDHNPVLYFELRQKGRPINPLPWLVARKGKASG